ncbi:MAG: hypothetical protein AB7O74_13750 [Candidatus Nanopelagicales bacterium]
MSRARPGDPGVTHDEALDGWLSPSEWRDALLEGAADHEECDWHHRAPGEPLVQRPRPRNPSS